MTDPDFMTASEQRGEVGRPSRIVTNLLLAVLAASVLVGFVWLVLSRLAALS